MKYLILKTAILLCSAFAFISCNSVYYINLAEYGVKPGEEDNCTVLINKALQKIEKKISGRNFERVHIILPEGEYHFYPDSSMDRDYYISNHDQVNPKNVGMEFKRMLNVTFDASGSRFIYHGRMLPIGVIECRDFTLKNFSVDFIAPQITQMEFVKYNEADSSAILKIAPWVNYKIENGVFKAFGEGWELTPSTGIAFDKQTKHIVYNTGDIFYSLKNVKEDTEQGERCIYVPNWKYKDFEPGTVIAGRTWYRPAPGIFLHFAENTSLTNIKVHYSEGMGLLAQGCNNIFLNNFNVCLKGEDDSRYFTTQADATHFSGCKGMILSESGLYENMMDDAINVHGTYLRILDRINDTTVQAAYMHSQAYGFKWGEPGDSVQFIQSVTMELYDGVNIIKTIQPTDQPTEHGAKQYRVTFKYKLPDSLTLDGPAGIENLTYTPKVIFANNIIRNNRARGALFSTPRTTIVRNNNFDHTSGSAILLCGDCNGWFETGACRDVLISGNTFNNALTNMFQFTNAVISIYPEIPDLKNQVKYFHGVPGKESIVIENNTFNLFDKQALYAKSVTGLVFRDNIINYNTMYKPFHWNKELILLERVDKAVID